MLKEDHLKTKIKIVSFLLFLVCIYFILEILMSNNIHFDCLILKYTGYYCPGCGISRMILSLFRGQFYQAFRWNPLLFISLIIVIIYLLLSIFIKIKISDKNKLRIMISYLIIVILFAILRNIPMFSFLAPTKI